MLIFPSESPIVSTALVLSPYISLTLVHISQITIPKAVKSDLLHSCTNLVLENSLLMRYVGLCFEELELYLMRPNSIRLLFFLGVKMLSLALCLEIEILDSCL